VLTREEVFIIIDRERDFQDVEYNPTAVIVPGGPTREQRDLLPAAGILLLEEYVRKATTAWAGQKGSDFNSLRQVAKIAAIAVRILERAADSERLLTEGLR
jgi:hypothetical protein